VKRAVIPDGVEDGFDDFDGVERVSIGGMRPANVDRNAGVWP